MDGTDTDCSQPKPSKPSKSQTPQKQSCDRRYGHMHGGHSRDSRSEAEYVLRMIDPKPILYTQGRQVMRVIDQSEAGHQVRIDVRTMEFAIIARSDGRKEH